MREYLKESWFVRVFAVFDTTPLSLFSFPISSAISIPSSVVLRRVSCLFTFSFTSRLVVASRRTYRVSIYRNMYKAITIPPERESRCTRCEDHRHPGPSVSSVVAPPRRSSFYIISLCTSILFFPSLFTRRATSGDSEGSDAPYQRGNYQNKSTFRLGGRGMSCGDRDLCSTDWRGREREIHYKNGIKIDRTSALFLDL